MFNYYVYPINCLQQNATWQVRYDGERYYYWESESGTVRYVMPRGLRACSSCDVQFGRYQCCDCPTTPALATQMQNDLQVTDGVQQDDLPPPDESIESIESDAMYNVGRLSHETKVGAVVAMCLECWHTHREATGHIRMREHEEHVHRAAAAAVATQQY
jgi:hypothetical protein